MLNLSACPPANSFTAAGKVVAARFAATPPFVQNRRRTGRRAQGVRYERKVQEYLSALYPDTYVESPWLTFDDGVSKRWRWCQPDGIHLDLARGVVTIVEVKYQHTSDAWWQLERLYRPVLEHLFPPRLWTFKCVEVVKWYDPSVVFPCPVKLSESPLGVGEMSVHIWKP